MTRQAIQLGWMPRLPIKQTSQEGYGQIYVGPVELAADARDTRSDGVASANPIISPAA